MQWDDASLLSLEMYGGRTVSLHALIYFDFVFIQLQLTRQHRRHRSRSACRAGRPGCESVSGSLAYVAGDSRVEPPQGWLVGVLPLRPRPAWVTSRQTWTLGSVYLDQQQPWSGSEPFCGVAIHWHWLFTGVPTIKNLLLLFSTEQDGTKSGRRRERRTQWSPKWHLIDYRKPDYAFFFKKAVGLQSVVERHELLTYNCYHLFIDKVHWFDEIFFVNVSAYDKTRPFSYNL